MFIDYILTISVFVYEECVCVLVIITKLKILHVLRLHKNNTIIRLVLLSYQINTRICES